MDIKMEGLELTYETGYQGPSWMLWNVNKDNRLALISHSDVQSSDFPVTAIDGYESLCSYNWMMSNAPTIYIPGTPRKWDPPALPKRLGKPTNRNGLRQKHMREQHFEPIFKALETMNPSFRFNNIDVVVNRHILQLLYKFVSQRSDYGEICLDLQLVGKTLIITRRQKQGVINAWDAGYKRRLRDEFTEEDPYLRGADRHYRAIKYTLGSLNMVVRTEPTGYFDHPPILNESKAPHEISSNSLYGKTSWNAPKNSGDISEIRVECQGTWIPHNDTMELAIIKEHEEVKELVEQHLWFGRIRHTIFGHHSCSFIKETEGLSWTAKAMQTYADDNQENLRRLVWLLERIRKVVMDGTDGAAVLVVLDHGEPLKIFEARTLDGALDKETVARFWV